jgi:ethanolamine utilization cobalamin adenosyltransferase
MKVITEAILRDELRASRPEVYTVPEGKILSPAAREYLQQCRIRIDSGAGKKTQKEKVQITASEVTPMPEVNVQVQEKPKFVDDATGAFYYEKPEHMTHLYGNVLVPKDNKRIVFRGKLDSLEAVFVLNQTLIKEAGGDQEVIDDLEDILNGLREMMRCDVLNEPFIRDSIIGLTHKELRERSHNPAKFYGIRQMILPSCTLGKTYALLNQLRTAVRETEVAAVSAYYNGKTYEHRDIIQELNRMSSAMHIIMCKYLAANSRE